MSTITHVRQYAGPLCPPWCEKNRDNFPPSEPGPNYRRPEPHRVDDAFAPDEAHIYHSAKDSEVGPDVEGGEVTVGLSWSQYLNPRENEPVVISVGSSGDLVHMPAATARTLAAKLLALADQVEPQG